MPTKDFLVKLPPTMHMALYNKAQDKQTSMSQEVREALCHHLNYEMDYLEFDERNPKQNKKVGATSVRHTTPVRTISLKLPRYMEGVIKILAQAKDLSIASLIGFVIKGDVKGIPSKAIKRDLANGQWRQPHPDNIPKVYTVSVYVPTDWMPVLEKHAKYYGISVGKFVERVVLLRMQRKAVIMGFATQEELVHVEPLDDNAYREQS